MTQPLMLEESLQATAPRFIRQRYPLVHLCVPVTFLLPEESLELTTSDFSDEELRISCSASEIPKLVPRTAHHRPDKKILHLAALQLDDKKQIRLQLQVNACRRYSQKEFKVSFFILDASEQDQQVLKDYLEEALANKVQLTSILN